MKTFTNDKGQLIGYFDPKTKIFRKVVNDHKHLMRIYDAYAIEKSVLDQLERLKCAEVRIRNEKGDIYHIAFPDIIQHGFLKNHDTPQWFIPRKFFTLGKLPKTLFT